METGFKDSIKPKKIDPKNKPIDGKNSPWDFRAPQYDERSSCFIEAGTCYGIGHKTPVGKIGQESNKGPIPYGQVQTMKIDEV